MLLSLLKGTVLVFFIFLLKKRYVEMLKVVIIFCLAVDSCLRSQSEESGRNYHEGIKITACERRFPPALVGANTLL